VEKKRARSPSSAQNQLVPVPKKEKLKSSKLIEADGKSTSDEENRSSTGEGILPAGVSLEVLWRTDLNKLN